MLRCTRENTVLQSSGRHQDHEQHLANDSRPPSLPIEQHPLHTASSTTGSSGIPLPQALASRLTARLAHLGKLAVCLDRRVTGWCRARARRSPDRA